MTFNDARKKDYERLFTLPPETRAKDAAYQGLSAEDRKVVESLAELPAPQRTDAMLELTRKQSFQFHRDALALRQSSPAFRADAEVKRVYTHNDDSVMAFTRKSGGEEYLVVGSMNRENLKGYVLPLPPGNWKEVLNSDAAAYGGGHFGNAGAPWGREHEGEHPGGGIRGAQASVGLTKDLADGRATPDLDEPGLARSWGLH